jgi:hypothetical protein
MFSEIWIKSHSSCKVFWIFFILSQIDKNCPNSGSWILIPDNFSHLFSNFQYSNVNPKRNPILHSVSKSSILFLSFGSLFLINIHFELFDN